jgi:hypothetical protein
MPTSESTAPQEGEAPKQQVTTVPVAKMHMLRMAHHSSGRDGFKPVRAPAQSVAPETAPPQPESGSSAKE